MTYKAENFFAVNNILFDIIFKGREYVWDGLASIEPYFTNILKSNISQVPVSDTFVTETAALDNGAVIHKGSYLVGDRIEISDNAVIEPGAFVKGPCYIGKNTEVRHGAYIRGNVIAGDDCIIGHATEIKNSILMGSSKAGHFAYIGDSILGSCNLGAGTKLANLKLNNSMVTINNGEEKINTGLRKLGAIIGDACETGCNSVTAPGTVLSKNCILYPNTSARAYYPPSTIIKLKQNIEKGEYRL